MSDKIKYNGGKTMKTNVKCFVKNEDGQYYEIKYDELCKCCEVYPEMYAKKKFFPLQGMLLEVTPEQYKSLYKDYERQRYLDRLDGYYNPISLNALKNDKSMLIKSDADVFKIVEGGILLESLKNALNQLNEQEIFIINALFFDQKTDAALSRETGIPRSTITSRKIKILKKLRKIVESK